MTIALVQFKPAERALAADVVLTPAPAPITNAAGCLHIEQRYGGEHETNGARAR
jgi:hypothetical protein